MFENKNICRTCLKSEHELLSIFASVETGTRISDYFKLYLNHSLNENDGLPQKICLQCIHKILEVKKFYCQIKDSEEHLRRQIEKVKSSTTEIIGLFEEDEIKSEGVSEVSEIEGFSCEETNSDDIVEYAPLETITFLLDEETSFVDIEEDPLVVEEFKCSLCNETFKYEKNFKIHIKRDHNAEIEISHSENTNSPSEKFKAGINPTNDDDRIQGREEHFNQVHENTNSPSDTSKAGINPTNDDDRIQGREEHFNQVHENTNSPSDKSKAGINPTNDDDRIQGREEHFKQVHEDGKRYSCHICGRTFLGKHNLACHLWIHIGENPFQCDICCKRFTQPNALVTHMTLHSEDTVKCPLCVKRFHNSYLNAHIRKHNDERPHACDMCPKRYKKRTHLLAHQYTHSGTKPFSCKTCGKCFKQKSYLRQHYFVHIGRPYKCPACVLTFIRPHKLGEHLVSAHGIYDDPMKYKQQLNTNNDELKEDEQVTLDADVIEIDDEASLAEETSFVDVKGKPLAVEEFKCSLCHETFKYEKNLKTHIARDHNDKEIEKSHSENTNLPLDTSKGCINSTNDDGRIQEREEHFNQGTLLTSTDESSLCPMCGAHFNTRKHLIAHMQTHCEDRKRYPCHICERTFFRKRRLAFHLWTHTAEKSFRSDIYRKRFTQQNALVTHMTLHTGQNVKCPLCDKCFSRPSLLKVHIREHADERPYVCEICTKRFRQKSHLAYHQLTHSGAKPFSCETCGKCFTRKSYLKQHNFIHTERSYKCPECILTFQRPYSLRVHLVSAHGICDESMKYKQQLNTNNDELKGGEQVALEADVIEIDDEASLDEETTFVDVEGDPLELEEFKCSLCDEMFKYEKDLVMHIKRDHSDEEIEKSYSENTNSHSDTSKGNTRKHTDERPYACEICLKRYKKKDHLVAHQYTHFGIKPFSCKFCDKRFKQKSYLRDHIFVHVGRPYKCPVCALSFVRPHKLGEHLVSTHGMNDDPIKYKQQFNINKLEEGEQVIFETDLVEMDDKDIEIDITKL